MLTVGVSMAEPLSPSFERVDLDSVPTGRAQSALTSELRGGGGGLLGCGETAAGGITPVFKMTKRPSLAGPREASPSSDGALAQPCTALSGGHFL